MNSEQGTLNFFELRDFLEERYLRYHNPEFIKEDPIQISHRYTQKIDIEIAGFLSANIAWGQRKSIVANASKLMMLMDDTPGEFVIQASPNELHRLASFVHRTFQPDDCLFFIRSLRNIYTKHGGLETVFNTGYQATGTIFGALAYFRNIFFEEVHLPRSEKHISNVLSGASAKRLNMFLRWMVRDSRGGVDFGLWKDIPASALYLPLDVHTGNVSRSLGLLTRTANDWKAVEEVTANLRTFDPNDPVKYDFALFGLGIVEKWH